MAQEKEYREDNAKKYSHTVEFEFNAAEKLKYSAYFETLCIHENASLRKLMIEHASSTSGKVSGAGGTRSSLGTSKSSSGLTELCGYGE
jgi:hypothetical protein